MTHWGWFWRIKKKHLTRTLCPKLVSIDSFKILKHNNTAYFIVQPLDIKAIQVDDHLKITYRNRKETSYSIPIEKQSCNYGGFRYYFKCPLCQKRMRLLYFAEKSIFLCRKCLNLGYLSQRLRPTKLYAYTADNVKKLIEKKGGTLYEKPPRMHSETFKRLRSKHFYYESKSHQTCNKELREWYGARAEPYLDDFFDYVDENKDWRKKRSYK